MTGPARTSVARVASVLRALSTSPHGASTSSLAVGVDLPRPTVHRLLMALSVEGLVDRDPGDGRWLLGPEAYLLGHAAQGRYEVPAAAREAVRLLASSTGESAFYSIRRNTETVCLLREDGSFPIRSFVLFEGARFPLGVVSAGLVILAFLPDREVEEVLGAHNLVPTWGPAHEAGAVRKRLEETRRLGYAVNPGLVVEGSWGMAAAVFDAAGLPVAALSITGVQNRFRARRRTELGRTLLMHAHTVGRAVHGTD